MPPLKAVRNAPLDEKLGHDIAMGCAQRLAQPDFAVCSVSETSTMLITPMAPGRV
jgi:hypothetical protein